MLRTNYFIVTNRSRKNILCAKFKSFLRAFCSGKKGFADLLKEKPIIIADESFKNKSPEEIGKVAYMTEDEIAIAAEKAREACMRSQLSKECNTLLSHKRISLMSTGLNLSLEPPARKKGATWEDYSFDRTIDHIKSECVKPTAPVHYVDCSNTGSSGSSSNRPVRGEPGGVLCGFIPEEWVRFFIPVTGVTGFGTFVFTLSTFLISKEYYVLEHEFYGAISLVIFWYFGITTIGPGLAQNLDTQIAEYEAAWEKNKVDEKKSIEENLEHEALLQFQAEGQPIVLQAKRENILFQLEDEFRKRQMRVHDTVKERLDYHVQVALIHQKIQQKNLIQYVYAAVMASISPDMHNQLINYSIEKLEAELQNKNVKDVKKKDDDHDGDI